MAFFTKLDILLCWWGDAQQLSKPGLDPRRYCASSYKNSSTTYRRCCVARHSPGLLPVLFIRVQGGLPALLVESVEV